MRTEKLRIPVGEADSVGATIAYPYAKPRRTGVLLAHGAGNDRFSDLLCGVQRNLARRGGAVCATFNFLYAERGRRIPDPLPVLVQTYREVFRSLRQSLARHVQQWVIGGKSLGGRVASHLVAEGEEACGLVFLGYPLHPRGKPEQLRTEHLRRIAVPMLFVQGSRDPLCDLNILEGVLDELRKRYRRKVRLAVIWEGDHSFVVPRRLGLAQELVYAEIADQVARWLNCVEEGDWSS